MKIEHKDENSITRTTSKVICLSCKDTAINFYDFYRVVQTNQSLFREYAKKVQPNASPVEDEQPPRFIFTIRTTSDGVALLNDCGTLEYSLDADVSDDNKSNQSENSEKPALQNYGVVDENSVNIPSDSRTVGTYDEANLEGVSVEAVGKIDSNNDCDSNNKTLFSRKNIDEKLPDHLKVRTSKEQSDAQIKEFVNLNCDICKTATQFNSFKELQEHFNLEHNQRGYVECCDKKFYRKDRLMNHITNHIYPDAFK